MHRSFRAVKKHQGHAITGRKPDQFGRGIGRLEMWRVPHQARQLGNDCGLLIDEQRRIPDNVYEQDMCDLQFGLRLEIISHLLVCPCRNTVSFHRCGRNKISKRHGLTLAATELLPRSAIAHFLPATLRFLRRLFLFLRCHMVHLPSVTDHQAAKSETKLQAITSVLMSTEVETSLTGCFEMITSPPEWSKNLLIDDD